MGPLAELTRLESLSLALCCRLTGLSRLSRAPRRLGSLWAHAHAAAQSPDGDKCSHAWFALALLVAVVWLSPVSVIRECAFSSAVVLHACFLISRPGGRTAFLPRAVPALPGQQICKV